MRLVPINDELRAELRLWPSVLHSYLVSRNVAPHVEPPCVGKCLSRMLWPR